MQNFLKNLAGDSLTTDSGLDSLTNHSVPGNISTHDDGDSLTLDSGLDSLTPHSVPIVVGMDWERDGWRVSVGGEVAVKVSRSDLLVTDLLKDADVVVVEQAHMRPRDVYSVAQVYWPDELRQLPFRDKIKMFPGMPGQLARAARAVGNVTEEVNEYGNPLPDKEKDAETMALYAALHPEKVQTWRPFRMPDEDPARPLWEPRDKLRGDIKDALNPLRVAWNNMAIKERYALPEVDLFCKLLSENYDSLTDGVKDQFGIKRAKLAKKDGTPTAASLIGYGVRVERMAAALTVYLAAYTRDGDLRLNPSTDSFIGVRFILDSVGMSGTYYPNMARSQLTHHGMRHYKGGRDGGSRAEYMRNLRHFIQFLRDAEVAGDSLTSDSGLDSLTRHSVLGYNDIGGGDSLTHDSGLDSLTPHSVPAADVVYLEEVSA